MKNIYTFFSALFSGQTGTTHLRLGYGTITGRYHSASSAQPRLKIVALISLLLLGTSGVWAGTSTLTFTAACGGSGTADDGIEWTVSSDADESQFDTSRGVHYGTNKKSVSYIELTSGTFGTSKTITKVEVEASGSNTPSLSVTVGGIAFGSTQTGLTTSNVKYEFTPTAAQSSNTYQGVVVVNNAKSSSANGALYVKSVKVTYTTSGGDPTPTLSSIAVSTAPTKTTYTAGETFDPTGLVITRNYSSGDPDTYAYAGHTSDFTFSPDLSTALTTSDTEVTITYGGKSTTQAITVNAAGGGGSAGTGTINFGSADGSTKINSTSVTGDDDLGNEWTITTVGTTSFTPQPSYCQVGSGNNPATSITFEMDFGEEMSITAFSAKFGGFSGTAGNISLKVDGDEVGSGSLNASTDVISSALAANLPVTGQVLTVTVTGISKGVKCYYISYTCEEASTDPTIKAPDSVTDFTAVYGGGAGSSKTFSVSGKNLTGNLTVSIPSAADFEISSDGSTWGNSLTLTASAGTVSATNIYARLKSGLSVGDHSANVTISGGGATNKTVSLSGAVEVECSTPSLAFDGNVTTTEKILGSGKFTIAAIATGNTLGAAITYSSDKTNKAEVNETTGEVTLKEATGNGAPVTITATLAAKSTSTACQEEVTASYTLIIYNQVTWLVNSDDYTAGSPTTQVLQGGKVTQLPEDPDGETLCGGKVFIGWTDHEILDPEDDVPTPMYKTVTNLSSVNIIANKTFYAVFATEEDGEGGGGDYELVESAPDSWVGDYLIAYSDAIFADGRVGGSDENGAIGKVDVSVNPGDNLSDGVVAAAWGDLYNVTIEASQTTGKYLLKTKDGAYNYQTTNNNGLVASGNISVAENYPLNITFVSSSNIQIANDAGAIFHYNTGGYFRFYKNGTQSSIYLYKKAGSGASYSEYATVCGECLPAPSSPTVTPKSNRATITWTAVPDATGYTVTCTGGTVSVVGTTATITGLVSETTYNFTIKSQGGDPYTCFPKYNGTFTTTACEDAPILGTVTVTTTTATIPWTCEAATSTIRIYEDEECSTQVGSDYTSCTSPYTIEHLTSNTTYYYKIWSGGTCASPVGTFTTEELKLDLAEWQADAVIVSYNGDANLTLTTFTEETHGDPHANVADDIFFSKYFEAAANVKLLAIFNGTLSTVDLSNYQLGLAQAGTGVSTVKAFDFKKFSEIETHDGGNLTEDQLLLKSNEELILITYKDYSASDQSSKNDAAIVKCALEDEENSKFSTYVRTNNSYLQFNGDDVISLLDPDGNMIDLIGAGTKDDGLDRSGASFLSSATDFMDGAGWYTTTGYQANPDNTETAGYALSTNRCLLIRRKHVKSGHIAATLNATDFVTLGSHTYLGEERESEWKGVQIPGGTTTTSSPGITASCTGFNVVGSYNYNDYYIDYEINGTPTTFDDLKSDPFDGTYIIPVTGLVDKACTMVRVELTDGSDNLVIRKDVKVPIMISGDQNTTDDIFHSNDKDAIICRECDLVVLKGAKLTKVADGTTNDISQVRDVQVYPGGQLIIPADDGTNEYNYTVNSLTLRRQDEEVAMANIKGDLAIKQSKGVSLTLRVDPSNWHYVALPYDCNIADIAFSDGNPAQRGVDFFVKYYDGAYRAANKRSRWVHMPDNGVMKKGIGYIVGLAGNDIIKRELRFPMANTLMTEETDPEGKEVGGLYAYGGDKSVDELRPNHRGWNLIGNPYLVDYKLDFGDKLRTGKLIPDPDEPALWTIESGTEGVRYIVEAVNNGRSEYRQVSIAGPDYEMKPFTAYFIQMGGTDPTAEQGIKYEYGSSIRSAIVRRLPAEYEEDNHPVWCAVTLTNEKGEKDATTLLISNQFTTAYDMMDDLVKVRGTKYSEYTKPVLASRNDADELAFNALPDNSAKAGVPLNFFAATQGQYTIAVDGRYSLEEIKEVQLFDSERDIWHDLLLENYTFTSSRTDNTSRFYLYVTVERKRPQTPTDVDKVSGSLKLAAINHTLVLSGLENNADIYVYDMNGKLVAGTSYQSDAGNGIWRTQVSSQGVYFVRVNAEDGQQTLRTIVY